jgi:hypothetical protein
MIVAFFAITFSCDTVLLYPDLCCGDDIAESLELSTIYWFIPSNPPDLLWSWSLLAIVKGLNSKVLVNEFDPYFG